MGPRARRCRRRRVRRRRRPAGPPRRRCRVLPARLGPATASRGLRSPLALAWRLHRGSLLGWSVGFAVIGVVVGGASRSIDILVENSPQLRDMLQRLGGAATLKETYLAATLAILALAAAYSVQATLRLRSEAATLRAEPVLATATGRPLWMVSHLAFALLSPALVLAVLGLSASGANIEAARVLAARCCSCPQCGSSLVSLSPPSACCPGSVSRSPGRRWPSVFCSPLAARCCSWTSGCWTRRRSPTSRRSRLAPLPRRHCSG